MSVFLEKQKKNVCFIRDMSLSLPQFITNESNEQTDKA